MTSPQPTETAESRFATVLRERLQQYFSDRDLSPYGNREMAVKVVLGVGTLLLGIAVLYSVSLQTWEIPLVYVAIALPQTFLILAVAHDGVHGAISRRPWVNVLLGHTYDSGGVSSYLVRILHIQHHHFCINQLGKDDPLGGRVLLRLTRRMPRKVYHRFQHYYFALIYPMFSLDYVLMRDYVDIFRPKVIPWNRPGLRIRQVLTLLAGKVVYLAIMIALPIFYLGYPVGWVLVGFLLMHFVIGACVAAVGAPTHLLKSNDFPEDATEYPDFVHHIFATTSDFATESRLVTWLTGALNHHVVHHVVPDVCHVHYPALTRIAKETAAEFGIPYKEIPTMRGALLVHHELLRHLARTA